VNSFNQHDAPEEYMGRHRMPEDTGRHRYPPKKRSVLDRLGTHPANGATGKHAIRMDGGMAELPPFFRREA
jgi:hypothetical protein